MILFDIKTFVSNMLKVDKKRTKILTFTILNTLKIQYTVKNIRSSIGHSINNVNPLYLRIDNASGYIEEKGSNKCLIFD